MIEINLFKTKDPQKKGLSLQALSPRKILPPIGVALLALFFLESYKKEELEKVNQAMNKAQTQWEEVQKEKSAYHQQKDPEIDEKIATLQKKLKTLQGLFKPSLLPSVSLSHLSQVIPPEVWIEKITLNEKNLSLLGASLDFEKISFFLKELEKNPSFAGLELKQSRKKTHENGMDIAQFELQRNTP